MVCALGPVTRLETGFGPSLADRSAGCDLGDGAKQLPAIAPSLIPPVYVTQPHLVHERDGLQRAPKSRIAHAVDVQMSHLSGMTITITPQWAPMPDIEAASWHHGENGAGRSELHCGGFSGVGDGLGIRGDLGACGLARLHNDDVELTLGDHAGE